MMPKEPWPRRRRRVRVVAQLIVRRIETSAANSIDSPIFSSVSYLSSEDMMKLFTVNKQTQPMQTSKFSLGRESVNADAMKDAETRTNKHNLLWLVVVSLMLKRWMRGERGRGGKRKKARSSLK